MDYSHLGIEQLHLTANHFFIHKDTISAFITSGSMTDKSGFVLNSLYTDFQFTDKGIRAKNLLMKTPGSEVKRNINIRYPSLDAMINDKSLMELELTLDHSRVQVEDILYFAPFLADKPGFTDPEVIFDVHGRMIGSLKKLNFPSMMVRGLDILKQIFQVQWTMSPIWTT